MPTNQMVLVAEKKCNAHKPESPIDTELIGAMRQGLIGVNSQSLAAIFSGISKMQLPIFRIRIARPIVAGRL